MQPFLASAAPTPSPPHATAEAQGLLRLPNEILLKIWEKLSATEVPCNQHQHALRCTCRAMAHASNAWIEAFYIDVTAPAAAVAELDEGAALHECAMQLACFPSFATLTTLHWLYSGNPLPPPVLSSFLFTSGARLAAVRTMRLCGHAVEALHCGDMYGIAEACPQLQSLTLSGVVVAGPVFRPLACLPRLSSLRLEDVAMQRRGPCPAASLSCLHRLTQLIAYADDDAALGNHMRLPLQDLLPHLHSLSALRSLNLDLESTDAADVSALSYVTQLTSLTLWPPMETLVTGDYLCSLSATTTLVCLSLLHVALDTSAVRLLCALPLLTQLSAAEIYLDTDLRAAPCAWRELVLTFCRDPEQLLRLPLLHNNTRLYIQNDELSWTLRDPLSPPDGGATLSDLLHGAAEVLARLWAKEGASRSLSLDYRVSQAEGGPGSARLLAALGPLQCLPDLALSLSSGFIVSNDHVRQLAATLPSLRALAVDCSGPHFALFAAAVADALPSLRVLRVMGAAGYHAQGALLTLASSRARSGCPLALFVPEGMGDAERDSCNQILAANGAHGDICFCNDWGT